VRKHQGAAVVAATLMIVTTAQAIASASGVQSASRRPFGELDLVSGTLGGRELFSKRVAKVTASLGPPEHRIARKRLHVLHYGPVPRNLGGWSLIVHFRPKGDVLRANLLAFAGRALAERRLGRVLRLPPREFERRLLQAYGDHYDVLEPYRCRTKPLRCRGELVGRENGLAVGYGLLFPNRPQSRYITVYRR
jgi:hypothetical protein